jgi:hypothetical protein
LEKADLLPETKSAKSKTFETHLASYLPAYLYHYTTQNGVLGIFETGKLRATKVQYMNDAREFELALSIAIERIDARAKGESNSATHAKIALLSERLRKIANVNLFAACFCEDGDLLGQWRGYSGDSHGFSLGMHVKRLIHHAKGVGFEIGRCVYRSDDQVTIVEELISDSLQYEDDFVRSEAFEQGLIRVGAFFKSSSFEQEREWRLVSPTTSIKGSHVGFRQGKSMLVPYANIPLGSGADGAIDRAVVGPCPHPDLSQNSLQMLLIRHSLGPQSKGLFIGDNVLQSKIPFRNW